MIIACNSSRLAAACSIDAAAADVEYEQEC